jgi:hypothetical protein
MFSVLEIFLSKKRSFKLIGASAREPKTKKEEIGGFEESVVRSSDFYRLCRALSLACQTFYAVFFSGWVGLFLGIRMTR